MGALRHRDIGPVSVELLESPVDGLKLPRRSRHEMQALTVEQVRMFLKAALTTPHGGARHALEVVLPDGLHLDRRRPNATEFRKMRKQVEAWQQSELADITAKVVIYEAFIESKLEAPKHLARAVHDLYFEPKYEEVRPRTIWSLSNAFTSAFKELDPIPQFKAKLGEFLESQSF